MPLVFTDTFSCRQFSVCHAEGVARVGTDAFLVGCWGEVSGNFLLDLGTGSGILALLFAQRNPLARIDAIDHHGPAAELAAYNFSQSSWSDRLHAIHKQVQDFDPGYTYDAIVCNPPFFQPGKALLATGTGRRNVRHALALPLHELMQAIRRLITPVTGRASLILPVQSKEELLLQASDCGLFPARITTVVTVEGKSPERILIALAPVSVPCSETELVIKSGGRYTEDYRQLFTGFYLHV